MKRPFRLALGNQRMCRTIWDVEEYIRLCCCMSHKYFKDAKAIQINRILKFKLNLTYQARSNPKIIGILTKVFGTSGWPWRSRSNTPKNNTDLNQGPLHLWSKFVDPSLNGWCVIARRSTCLPQTQTDGRTHRQTDAGNDNTRRPKLASGKNY